MHFFREFDRLSVENLFSGGAQMNYVGIDHHRQYSHMTLIGRIFLFLRRGEFPPLELKPPSYPCLEYMAGRAVLSITVKSGQASGPRLLIVLYLKPDPPSGVPQHRGLRRWLGLPQPQLSALCFLGRFAT